MPIASVKGGTSDPVVAGDPDPAHDERALGEDGRALAERHGHARVQRVPEARLEPAGVARGTARPGQSIDEAAATTPTPPPTRTPFSKACSATSDGRVRNHGAPPRASVNG